MYIPPQFINVSVEDVTLLDKIQGFTGFFNLLFLFVLLSPVPVSVHDVHDGNSSMSFFVEITTEVKK